MKSLKFQRFYGLIEICRVLVVHSLYGNNQTMERIVMGAPGAHYKGLGFYKAKLFGLIQKLLDDIGC